MVQRQLKHRKSKQHVSPRLGKELESERPRISRKKQEKLNRLLVFYANPAQLGNLEQTIKAGAEINARDDNGWTALHHATCNICSEACALLLQNGADINAKTNDGMTALMLAANYGNDDVCLCLLENGAKMDATDNNGWTAYIHAKSDPVNLYKRSAKTKAAELLKLYPLRKMLGKDSDGFVSSFEGCVSQ